jgi:hypothetical protein
VFREVRPVSAADRAAVPFNSGSTGHARFVVKVSSLARRALG